MKNTTSSEKGDHFLSDEVVNVLNISFNCVGVSLVSIFGIVGNIMNILVLFRHGFKESTNILLFSLSICDFIVVVTMPFRRLNCLVKPFDPILATTIDSLATVIVFIFSRWFLMTSLGHIGVISLERFVAIFFPFHVSRWITPFRMSLIVIGLYIFYFILLAPCFGYYYLNWTIDEGTNRTVALVELTDFYLDNQKWLDVWVVVLGNYLGPTLNLVVVLFCCAAIFMKLARNSAKRAEMTGGARSANNTKVSLMLVILCSVFFAIYFPTTVLDLYLYYIVEEDLMTDPRYVVLQLIMEFPYCLNSSVNFLIYVTMSKKYHDTYKQLLSCNSKTN